MAFLFARTRSQFGTIHWIILSFMALGLFRTIPYVKAYGVDAIRDAALWYYGAFALLVATLVTSDQLMKFLRIYARLLPGLLLWFLVMSTLLRLVDDKLPHFPGSPLPVLSAMKAGDRAVILVGLAVFVATGLHDRFQANHRMARPMFWILWLACAGLVAVESRGGFLAISVTLLVVFVLHPSVEWLKVAVLGAAMLGALLAVDPSIELGGSRQLSAEQLTTNVTSIFSNDTTNEGGVQDNKDWRLRWWKAIYDDTIRGSRLWSGWGFGINLADLYRFQIDDVGSLRSPHNGHVTVLARMGLPGLALWLTLHGVFAGHLIGSIRLARRRADTLLEALGIWILALWMAAMINGAFDVYLEGPQGAIPLWCAMGVGIVLMKSPPLSDPTASKSPAAVEPRLEAVNY
jgi:O-antigen ligase